MLASKAAYFVWPQKMFEVFFYVFEWMNKVNMSTYFFTFLFLILLLHSKKCGKIFEKLKEKLKWRCNNIPLISYTFLTIYFVIVPRQSVGLKIHK